MSEQSIVDHLTRGSTWLRAVFMILFYIVTYIVRFLIAIIAVVQFFFVLVSGDANQPLKNFGQGLSEFAFQIYRYLTFNTDTKPFPFSDWPGQSLNKIETPADSE